MVGCFFEELLAGAFGEDFLVRFFAFRVGFFLVNFHLPRFLRKSSGVLYPTLLSLPSVKFNLLLSFFQSSPLLQRLDNNRD